MVKKANNVKQFHITEKGVPAECKAQPGKCPRGGEHFPTLQEANEYASKQLESKYGYTPQPPQEYFTREAIENYRKGVIEHNKDLQETSVGVYERKDSGMIGPQHSPLDSYDALRLTETKELEDAISGLTLKESTVMTWKTDTGTSTRNVKLVAFTPIGVYAENMNNNGSIIVPYSKIETLENRHQNLGLPTYNRATAKSEQEVREDLDKQRQQEGRQEYIQQLERNKNELTLLNERQKVLEDRVNVLREHQDKPHLKREFDEKTTELKEIAKTQTYLKKRLKDGKSALKEREM